MTQPIHATAVARFCNGGWRGALLRGPSGAGKSDLALRLMKTGWALVGDDYVHAFSSSGALYVVPAERIAGRIEARGLGIVDVAHRGLVKVRLVVDLVTRTPERLPDPNSAEIEGIRLPRLILGPRPASATATLDHAIRRL